MVVARGAPILTFIGMFRRQFCGAQFLKDAIPILQNLHDLVRTRSLQARHRLNEINPLQGDLASTRLCTRLLAGASITLEAPHPIEILTNSSPTRVVPPISWSEPEVSTSYE